MALWNPFSIEAKVRRAMAKAERDRVSKRLSAAFLAKGLLFSALVAGSVVLLASRYSIAIASQDSLCLPPYRLWIIDKSKEDLVRGEIYAFHSKGLSPIFPDGTIIVKVLEGMPGDHAKVTLDETTINGVSVAKGLQVASQHGIDPQKYIREGVIGEGRYWFFGRTADSFDSRYWGSAATDQIIGKAYPIW
ncbi:TPA: S26 family signal peptidase [Pseudomonas aeruginosa]|jgi:conjugal transfer pilin signal peptidase TrbI|uniref:S26 family signal peptidase n=1 Tax=Pseudomonas aeruginosa TaxID=287 RepID=UPI00232FB460|nr:S26 family signal peptidase [Pseudomonas aeruginosa]EKU6310639.1 S26 family signal peptidase [Pseudomonas aeruginosa]EKX2972142.1 S26 family signal peptidase [Pseudomonas aeruginosa]ELL2376220.1 S26 family signal peptidase [Pseudomonas aeruginosa]EMB2823958.1 S26 family signal peptidase [Pseudomonas aeruginosa]MDS9770556.1 S26 family signal peptidase [Pseudomonas aeruginosa]